MTQIATEPGRAAPERTDTARLCFPQPLTLIDVYLREQQQLSAVAQFARDSERDHVPGHAKLYAKLMPATPPRPGEQYAFQVDLDRCSGCKACVTACHSLNGLDEEEVWRDVGLLIGGTEELPVLQHVTTACHHCIEPACAEACPVDAYEKDPLTGIVQHLDDQCIGCQYCTLACPYDVPKYLPRKGIVRKCDLCSQRLAVGEAPACVQACPHEAISITVVNQQQVLRDSEASQFLPGAPEPQHTIPTTNFKTARVLPRNLLPADYFAVRPEHAHWPLVVMLVLTQFSVGAFLVELVLKLTVGSEMDAAARSLHAGSALGFGLLALGASVLHLGRPLLAFRAVIGVRHSWLSREILAFGLFAPLAAAYAAALWMSPFDEWTKFLGGAVVVTGLVGVGCSVMVYAVTRRVFWNAPATAVRFLLTTLLLGAAAALATATLFGARWESSATERLAPWMIALAACKLAFESLVFRHLRDRQHTAMKRTALLMTRELSRVTLARFGLGLAGGALLPALLLTADAAEFSFQATVVVVAFAAVFAGELLERYLFFTAVVRRKMPGGLTG